ncbi:LysR family transcriptional regulator [Nocardioides sp. AN3]
MTAVLDIAPLRSLVAVADAGGFQRAADSLHLSQAAISQHVRRLEAAVGRPLVERHGRGSRFTAAGEQLLGRARRILALHDETLQELGMTAVDDAVAIGSTEHAAAQLLPFLAAELGDVRRLRFRLDRGTKLREAIRSGSLDLALLLNASEEPGAIHVGELALTWYAAPHWRRPAAGLPVPVVAFDNPCALRTRALETLAQHAIPAVIGAEAIQLAGVQAAVGAGVGVALLATLGQTPEGLIARPDLPTPEPLPLYVCAARAVDRGIVGEVAEALRRLLGAHDVPRPVQPLAQGA